MALLLIIAASLFGATKASAIDLPNPIGDAILSKICPARVAPYPASPSGPVVKRGGGAGLYANYDYAGLRWTTWDASCLSWDKADTSIGTQINAVANSMDQLINEVQIAALDDSTTASFDTVIERALVGLRDAFWSPWSAAGLAVAGLLVVAYAMTGREGSALSAVGGAAVVVIAMSALLANPHMPAQASNAVTSGVAQKVAGSLIAVTPNNALPDTATPTERFGEGFYQVSYRAWLEGWSCGDADAEARYGRRLLDAQAFTVGQLRATEHDPAAQEALVKAKQADWVRIGKEMPKTNPQAFGCWKGEGNSRTGAAVKHGVVTMSAGFWIIAGSVTMLALKWVLRLAILFFVAFGAVALFSQRLRDKLAELALLGFIGPSMVCAAVGTLLWFYYAVLLDSAQSWWLSAVSAFAMGLAMWFSKGILTGLVVGMTSVSHSSSAMRRGARHARHSMGSSHTSSHTTTGGGGAVAGGLAGGAAGAIVGGVVAQHNDDARRGPDEAPQHTEGAPPMSTDRDTEAGAPPAPAAAPAARPAADDAPAQALARARAMAASQGHYPQPYDDGGRRDPEPPGPEPRLSDDDPRRGDVEVGYRIES